MNNNHETGRQASEISEEDKALFDSAEQDILDNHREETGKKMARRALEVYNVAQKNGEPDVMGAMEDLDLLDEESETGTEEETVAGTDVTERARAAEEAMRELIKESFLESATSYHRQKREQLSLELLLSEAEAQARRHGESRVSSRSEVTDRLRSRIKKGERQIEELAEQSPESHVVVHGYEFRDLVRQIAHGEIARTPYVERNLKRVEDNMAEGRPTFLHGHLGSGKTELAIAAAKHSAIARVTRAEAFEEYKAFCDANPEASGKEKRDALARAYRRRYTYHERNLQSGKEDLVRGEKESAVERYMPLIISGSKDLTSQDMFTDKTLKVARFDSKPLMEHVSEIEAQMREWEEQNPEAAKDSRSRSEAAQRILEMYKQEHQAFGTQVEIVKKEILRGVEEGRPVIIDEANAIPSAILISLNDLLQRRPGDQCYIPGAGSITIAEGFSLTLTGNLSTGSVTYGGTGELNPAFLSRLDIIEHDYLPMSSEGSFEDMGENLDKNELFKVVIAYLADKDGNLALPEMQKTLSKLFRLSQLAHQTQIVFEGKANESNMLQSNSGDDVIPELKQSVLSIRNLLNVLKKWDKGSEMDLDTALWEGFVGSIADADDRNMVIAMAIQSGFFSETGGWDAKVKERGSGLTTLEEMHPGAFDYEAKPLETYDLRQVVDMLYGQHPERRVYPDINLSELEDEVDDELTTDDIETYQGKLEELTNAIGALEVLYNQCGCNVSQGE